MQSIQFKYYLFVCIALVLTAVSCKVSEVNVGDVKNVQIQDMDKNKMCLQLDLPIENTNNFKFKITKVNLEVTLNQSSLGKVKKFNKVTVPANSNQVHSFIFEIQYKDLMNNTFSLIGGLLKNRADIKIDGYIKVRAFMFISKKIDIHEDNSVKLFNRKK